MVMSTVWSLSRVEMRTVWQEEHGIGACSGREYHLARERRPRENIPPSPTGTHTHTHTHRSQHANIHPCSVCVSISHPFIPPVLSFAVSRSVLVSNTPPHVFVFSLALPSVFACCFPACTPSLQIFPPCILYAWSLPYSVRTVCTVPLIDSIHGQKFTIEPQGGGDQDGFARGAWDWSMLWKRVPLGDREKRQRKSRTEPYRYRKTDV